MSYAPFIISKLTNDNHVTMIGNGLKWRRLAGHLTSVSSGRWQIYRLQNNDTVGGIMKLQKETQKKNHSRTTQSTAKQQLTYINRYAWQRKHLCRWHVTWNISIEFVAVFVPFDRVQHLVVERIMAFQAGRTIAYGVIGNANLGQSQCKRQACVGIYGKYNNIINYSFMQYLLLYALCNKTGKILVAQTKTKIYP